MGLASALRRNRILLWLPPTQQVGGTCSKEDRSTSHHGTRLNENDGIEILRKMKADPFEKLLFLLLVISVDKQIGFKDLKPGPMIIFLSPLTAKRSSQGQNCLRRVKETGGSTRKLDSRGSRLITRPSHGRWCEVTLRRLNFACFSYSSTDRIKCERQSLLAEVWGCTLP